MAELALNDVERDAFAGHLDGLGVAELVGREAPADAGSFGHAAKLSADGGTRPRSPPRRAGDHAEQRPDGHVAA